MDKVTTPWQLLKVKIKKYDFVLSLMEISDEDEDDDYDEVNFQMLIEISSLIVKEACIFC